MIKPMLAKAARSIPADPAGERVIEIKYDGWRCIARRTEEGVFLYTRSGKGIISLHYICEALMSLPVGTVLDGELVGKPGAEWNQAQSVCSRHQPHIVCPASPALTFHVFDILHYAEADARPDPFSVRRSLVEAIVRQLDDPNIQAAEQFPCEEASALAILERGFEGCIVKRLVDPYVEDDRGIWTKVKPFEEIEAVCTGVFPGEGRLAGGAGGITFRVTHEDGTVYDGKCKGKVSEAFLQEIWDNPEPYIGRVVEIIHWGINEGGALRHPNLRRFRDPMEKAAPSVQPAPDFDVIRELNLEGRAPSGEEVKEHKSRGRNYTAMKDEKLLTSMIAIEAGNGKPNDDRDRCLAEVRSRGLI